MRLAAPILALLALSACSREAAFAPIPPQSAPVVAADPPFLPCFFSMNDERSDQAIVRDIPLGLGSGAHRWTAGNPTVRCKLPTAGSWTIAMDFIASDSTMSKTGPITLTFTVNGRQVTQVRCDKPGPSQVRAPLPPDLATPGSELVLEAAIDKPWVAPDDGAKLGVLVSAMGFIRP